MDWRRGADDGVVLLTAKMTAEVMHDHINRYMTKPRRLYVRHALQKMKKNRAANKHSHAARVISSDIHSIPSMYFISTDKRL